MSLKTQKNSSNQEYNYDDYSYTKQELLIIYFKSFILITLFSYTFYRSLYFFLAGIPFVFLSPKILKKNYINLRAQKLRGEFKEFLLILQSLTGAGYSVENAFIASIDELHSLYSDSYLIPELYSIKKKISLNKNITEAFNNFALRAGIEEIESFASILSIAKRSGGRLNEIMKNTISIIAEKIKVQEELMTITAAKRYEQKIMNYLPIGIIIYIDMTSPSLFNIMYSTIAGRIVMSIAMGIYILSIWMSKRILDIKL